MTSTELSKHLAHVGHHITPDVIKKDWQSGAPRNSSADYLAWRARRAEKTSRGDPELRRLRAEKLASEIAVLKERQIRDGRDNEEATRSLISREWMAERIHIAAGKVDGFRHKSEAEHPLLFAAAAGDVAKCREVVRKIWDDVLAAINSLAADFKEKEPHE